MLSLGILAISRLHDYYYNNFDNIFVLYWVNPQDDQLFMIQLYYFFFSGHSGEICKKLYSLNVQQIKMIIYNHKKVYIYNCTTTQFIQIINVMYM